MQNLFDLKNQVAAVIGGTGSLGGAMALSLASHGARVVIMGRNAENGAARVAEIAAAGGTAYFQAVDAIDRASLEDAQSEINAKIGGVSILVNAAGGNRTDATLPPGADFCDLELEGWDGVFDLNLVGGALLPCQVFGKTMLQMGGGSIINVASMAGMTAISRVVAYGAAKAAVLNLTQFLAREWATKGVRVNAISPGFFPAEQNRRLLFNEDGSYTARSRLIIGHTPMARFGNAHELAGATVFLASDAASGFMTGHNLVVDGGFSAMTI